MRRFLDVLEHAVTDAQAKGVEPDEKDRAEATDEDGTPILRKGLDLEYLPPGALCRESPVLTPLARA